MARRNRSFVDSVLSTRKQRARFFYFQVLSAPIIGVFAYEEMTKYINETLAFFVAFIAVFVAYKTVSKLIAFVICLIEGAH